MDPITPTGFIPVTGYHISGSSDPKIGGAAGSSSPTTLGNRLKKGKDSHDRVKAFFVLVGEAFKRAWENFKDAMIKMCESSVYDIVLVILKLVRKVGSILSTIQDIFEKILIADNITHWFLKTVDKVKNAWAVAFKEGAWGAKVLTWIKFVKLLQIPVVLYEIITSGFGMSKAARKKDWNDFGDELLKFTDATGDIADITAGFATGLHAVGAVAGAAVAWAGPLGLAAAALNTASIVLSSKQLWETRDFEKHFLKVINGDDRKKKEYKLEDLTKAMAFFAKYKKNVLAKRFKISGKELNPKLEALKQTIAVRLDSKDPEKIAEGQAKLNELMKELHERLISNQWNHGLKITSGVMSTAGLICLFTPCPIAGFSLAGAGAVVTIAQVIYERCAAHRFNKVLDDKQFLGLEPAKPKKVQKFKKLPVMATAAAAA